MFSRVIGFEFDKQELIDKVNKLSAKGEQIKKKALDKAGELVKNSMEKIGEIEGLLLDIFT